MTTVRGDRGRGGKFFIKTRNSLKPKNVFGVCIHCELSLLFLFLRIISQILLLLERFVIIENIILFKLDHVKICQRA